jgi:hypothetical protein
MVNGECISNRIHDRPRCEKSDLLTTCVGAIALSPARATKLGLFLRVLAPRTLLAQDWERSEDEESKGGREARMRRKLSRNDGLRQYTHAHAHTHREREREKREKREKRERLFFST